MQRPGGGWTQPMRLFVGVLLPREVVAVLATVPRPQDPGVRWSAPEQWHVTVRFLGEVCDVGGVAAALGQVPGRLRAEGVGLPEAALGPVTAWFAGGRILHVPVGGLDDLAGATGWALSHWSRAPEHPFTGHVTLARARRPGHGLQSPGAGAPVAIRWTVTGLALVASTLSACGARHRVVHRVPLG